MKKVFLLSKIKIEDGINGLRNLYNQSESSVRNLRTLETDTISHGSLLLPLINAKLPTDICVLRTRIFKSEVWDLNEMTEVLGTEIEANKTSAREKLMK